jgi:hypothetical protein
MLFLDENGQPTQVADRVPTDRIRATVHLLVNMMVRAGTVAGEFLDMPQLWGWPRATRGGDRPAPSPPANPTDRPADGWKS